ncbi:diguanylate cyclase [Thiohalophilus sp.]|uniref:diguanylate cyclase n=1 Tax=Thiohalophilus sp. TaxID=3028392 RepID=UPI003975D6A7
MVLTQKNNLTNQETESTIAILEKAIFYHLEWLKHLHESLICNTPFNDDVYREDAHRHCKLGQWYYTHAPDSLRSFKKFEQLEQLHTRMHDVARLLAQKSSRGEAITPVDYATFYHDQQKLIRLMGELRDQLIESSYSFDPLTGAINRNAFYLIAEKEHSLAERTGESYVVAMIDLDHFKQINDRYGHLTGDRILKETADLVQKRLRSSDVFCRFGGEEFIAFLPGTCLEDAANLFNAHLQSLANTSITIDDSGDSIQVTASAGLAKHIRGQTLNQIIEQADIQLYEAKGQGRNRLCYTGSSA